MNPPRFAEIEDEIVAHYGRGRYEEALQALDRAAPYLGAHWERVAYWRACLLARFGRHRQAVEVLAQAVEAGAWWAPRLLEMESDLDPLWDDRRYHELLSVMERRRSEWSPIASGLWLDGTRGGLPFIGLHGRNQVFETDVAALGSIGPGWEIAIPESAERIASDGAVWDDAERCYAQVQRVAGQLWGDRPFVLGGFSQGGRRALQIGLAHGTRAKGVLAVAPMVLRSAEIAEVVRAVGRPPWPRVAILAGEEDPAASGVATIASHLRDEGIDIHVEIFPGRGHEWIDPPHHVVVALADAVSN